MGIAAPQFARSADRLPIDVYIVSPNARIRQSLEEKLGLPRWRVSQAASGTTALDLLYKGGPNDAILLLDPMLPDLESNEFHGIVKDRFPNTQVLMLNSHTGQLLVGSASPTSAVYQAGGRGQPRRAVRPARFLRLRPRHPPCTEDRNNLRSMIGDSEPMQRTYTMMRMVGGARYHRADHGRKRHRQGSGGAGDSPGEPAPKAAFGGGELRGHS
jgi:DNA-binding NtrC family response regulator